MQLIAISRGRKHFSEEDLVKIRSHADIRLASYGANLREVRVALREGVNGHGKNPTGLALATVAKAVSDDQEDWKVAWSELSGKPVSSRSPEALSAR